MMNNKEIKEAKLYLEGLEPVSVEVDLHPKIMDIVESLAINGGWGSNSDFVRWCIHEQIYYKVREVPKFIDLNGRCKPKDKHG